MAAVVEQYEVLGLLFKKMIANNIQVLVLKQDLKP